MSTKTHSTYQLWNSGNHYVIPEIRKLVEQVRIENCYWWSWSYIYMFCYKGQHCQFSKTHTATATLDFNVWVIQQVVGVEDENASPDKIIIITRPIKLTLVTTPRVVCSCIQATLKTDLIFLHIKLGRLDIQIVFC